MQCPDCGRDMPDGDERCLYCGAPLKSPLSSGVFTTISRRETTTTSERGGSHAVTYNISEEEKNYDKLDALPSHLRDKIAEIMKQEGESVVQEMVDTKSSINFDSDLKTRDQDMTRQFSLDKPGRQRRLPPVVLFSIFLGSAALVGLLMWLTM